MKKVILTFGNPEKLDITPELKETVEFLPNPFDKPIIVDRESNLITDGHETVTFIENDTDNTYLCSYAVYTALKAIGIQNVTMWDMEKAVDNPATGFKTQGGII